MIIQGSNTPVLIDVFREDVTDMSVSLRVPGAEVKHWGLDDLTVDDSGLMVAPITQEESMAWEDGECTIEIKWTDVDGNTNFAIIKEHIVKWGDRTLLSEEDKA